MGGVRLAAGVDANDLAGGIGADQQIVFGVEGDGPGVAFAGLVKQFSGAVGRDGEDFAAIAGGYEQGAGRSKAIAQMYFAWGSKKTLRLPSAVTL